MKNFALALLLLTAACPAIGQEEWHNPMSPAVPMIGGRAWNGEIGNASFNRMPPRLVASQTKGVQFLQQHCAGMYVKFITDAKEITVRFDLHSSAEYIRNMAPVHHSGFDLYGKTPDGRLHWIGNHMRWKWRYNQVNGITITYGPLTTPSENDGGTEYLLYLPVYNGLKKMEIGVAKGSRFHFVEPSKERPIVVYGSSIIQGAAASRPGQLITNIIERDINTPVIDLGFSGNAFMEGALFAALSEIDARAFVLDPMPNSFQLAPDTITNRAIAGVKKIRSKSDAPILMVEAHGCPYKVFVPSKAARYRRADKCFRKAYDELVKEGVKNLYYLPSSEIDLRDNEMADEAHPNDLGIRRYVRAYEKLLAIMLNGGNGNTTSNK